LFIWKKVFLMLLLLDVQRLDAFLHSRALQLADNEIHAVKARLREALSITTLESVKAAAHILCNTLKLSGTPARQNVCFHGIAALYGMRTWNALRANLQALQGSPVRSVNLAEEFLLVDCKAGRFARFAFRVTFKAAGLRHVPDALALLASRVREGSVLNILTVMSARVEDRVLHNWRNVTRPDSQTTKILQALSSSRKARMHELAHYGFNALESVVPPRAVEHFLILDVPLRSESEANLVAMKKAAQELLQTELNWSLEPSASELLPRNLPTPNEPVLNSLGWDTSGQSPAFAADLSPVANWALMSETSTALYTYATFALNSTEPGLVEKSALLGYGIARMDGAPIEGDTLSLLRRSARAAGLVLDSGLQKNPAAPDPVDPLLGPFPASTSSLDALLSTLPTNASVLPGGKGGLLPVSKHGNLQTLDVWNPACGNTLTLYAPGGVGFSFLSNETVCDTLARNGQVRLWDAHPNRKLVHLMGGVVVFLDDEPVPLNPFAGATTRKEFDARIPHLLAFLADVLGERADSMTMQILAPTLGTAWEMYREGLSPQKWLRSLAGQPDYTVALGHAVNTRLAPANEWLECDTPPDLSNPFIVFSLDKLDARPESRVLISATIALAAIEASQDTQTPRLLSFGHADLLSRVTADTSARLREAVRGTNSRISVRVEDAKTLEPGTFHFDQVRHSVCRLFLGIRPKETAEFLKAPFELSPVEADSLRQVRAGAGYAEAAMQIQGEWMGTSRLVYDPLSYDAYSTGPDRPPLSQKDFLAYSLGEIAYPR
jgi:hypothetical protein